jgi:predicted RNase H-like nuclease (RuvC/YqgF family)
LHGGVHRYAAKVSPQIDTARAEKDRFRMKTKYYKILEGTMGKILITLVIVLSFVGTAAAETYKWIDGKGTINFTEDYSQIPKKYRKKVRIIGDVSGETPSMVTSGTEEKSNDQARKPAAGNSENGSIEKQEKKNFYGGKSGEAWKYEFSKLKAEIQNIQAQINEKRSRLNNTANLTRAQYLGIEYSIKDLETKQAELQDRQNTLDSAASQAGVPYELR